MSPSQQKIILLPCSMHALMAPCSIVFTHIVVRLPFVAITSGDGDLFMSQYVQAWQFHPNGLTMESTKVQNLGTYYMYIFCDVHTKHMY